MKLTEERKTYVVGVLLTIMLLCQIVGGVAGEKQQDAYNRINWLISHSNKSLILLSNLANLCILDKENTLKNFGNYRKGLNKTQQQHQQMSAEETQLLKDIECWGRIEQIVNKVGLILGAVVMILYLNLMSEISKRINKSR